METLENDEDILSWEDGINIYDDEDVLMNIIKDYTTSLKENMEILHSAMMSQDIHTIKSQSHKFKGNSLYVGAVKLPKVLQELNDWAKKGNLEKINQSYPPVVIEENRLQLYLNRDYGAKGDISVYKKNLQDANSLVSKNGGGKNEANQDHSKSNTNASHTFPVQMRVLKPGTHENEGQNNSYTGNSNQGENKGLQSEKPISGTNTNEKNLSNMPTKTDMSNNDEKTNDRINNPKNYEELDLRAAVNNDKNKNHEEEKLSEKKTEEGKSHDHVKSKLEMRLDPNILKTDSCPFKPRPKYSRKACGCIIF